MARTDDVLGYRREFESQQDKPASADVDGRDHDEIERFVATAGGGVKVEDLHAVLDVTPGGAVETAYQHKVEEASPDHEGAAGTSSESALGKSSC